MQVGSQAGGEGWDFWDWTQMVVLGLKVLEADRPQGNPMILTFWHHAFYNSLPLCVGRTLSHF